MALTGQKTFLQVQAQLGSQILGTQGGTSPYFDTTTRPTLAEAKQLINDAYIEVCSRQAWWFLFRELTFSTVVGQTTPYAVSADSVQVLWMNIPARQLKLGWLEYKDWETRFPGFYTNMGNMLPTFYVPGPPDATTNGLNYYLGPGPADQIYTVKYGSRLRITPMSADADVPLIRPEWQDVYILLAKAKIFDWLGQVDRYAETMDRFNGRMNDMWKFDQETEESSWRMKNSEDDLAWTPWTSTNISLFVPYGRG